MDVFCLLYLLLILSIRSGDVETNPGPNAAKSTTVSEIEFLQLTKAIPPSCYDAVGIHLRIPYNQLQAILVEKFLNIPNAFMKVFMQWNVMQQPLHSNIRQLLADILQKCGLVDLSDRLINELPIPNSTETWTKPSAESQIKTKCWESQPTDQMQPQPSQRSVNYSEDELDIRRDCGPTMSLDIAEKICSKPSLKKVFLQGAFHHCFFETLSREGKESKVQTLKLASVECPTPASSHHLAEALCCMPKLTDLTLGSNFNEEFFFTLEEKASTIEVQTLQLDYVQCPTPISSHHLAGALSSMPKLTDLKLIGMFHNEFYSTLKAKASFMQVQTLKLHAVQCPTRDSSHHLAEALCSMPNLTDLTLLAMNPHEEFYCKLESKASTMQVYTLKLYFVRCPTRASSQYLVEALCSMPNLADLILYGEDCPEEFCSTLKAKKPSIQIIMTSAKRKRTRGRTVMKGQKKAPAETRDGSVTPPQGGGRVRSSSCFSSTSSDNPDVEMPEPAKEQASTVPTQSQSKASPCQDKGKKRVRESKKNIPDYTWTVEATQQIADFVKERPQLYDKKEKEWFKFDAKARLWTEAGVQLDLPATGDQCKKLYENMRTRLGKILNKQNKSGSGQTNRTVIADKIVTMWGFLKEHIVHRQTVSDMFAKLGTSKSETEAEEQKDDLSSVGLEDTSIYEKGHVKKPRTSETPSTASPSVLSQMDLNDALRQVKSRVDTLEQTAALSGQSKLVHDFACLMEGRMQMIPEESLPIFEKECLNLVQRFIPPPQPSWQSSQESSQQWPAGSNSSVYTQWPAASQGYDNPVMPAAPSAAPVQGPSPFHHSLDTASSMTSWAF